VLSSTVGARGFSPELVDCLELVAPEPAALAAAIGSSLERDWSASTAKAREIVQNEYDWRVTSARYAELLHDTLGASAVPAQAAWPRRGAHRPRSSCGSPHSCPMSATRSCSSRCGSPTSCRPGAA
jgi:hypothetical protein